MTPKQMGRKGGIARMSDLTKKQRSELGKLAARKRWGKKGKPCRPTK